MKPQIVAVFGARGTGKSAYTKQLLRELEPQRLAVWDLMQEHADAAGFDRLGDAIRAMQAPSFAVAFYPSRDDKERAQQFGLWCRAVMAAGRLVAVVEELAFVTRPTWGPRAWREMVLLGRHPQHAVSIIGTSQRPASVDKDFLSNADRIHTGRLRYRADARTVGELVGVDWRELLALPDLAWVAHGSGLGSSSRGTLEFAGRAERRRPAVPVPLGNGPKGSDKQPTAERPTLRPPPFSLADLADPPTP